MAMQQSIKARLGATRLVLEQTVMCSDYVAISELQSKGLIDKLAKESLSDEEQPPYAVQWQPSNGHCPDT